MNSKKHKLPRRILAMLLAICMFVTMFPSAMFAVGDGNGQGATSVTSTENGVTVNKYVTGNEQEGYELTLEAYASDQLTTTTSTTPLDIVLVLDVSGSMDQKFTGSTTKYEPIYSNGLNQRTTYYIENGNDYREVNYFRHKEAWGYYEGDGWDFEFHEVIPKTSENDSDNSHTQFYEVITVDGQSKLKALQSAVNSFIGSVETNASTNNVGHKISIVKFSGKEAAWSGNGTYTDEGDAYNYSQIVKDLTDVRTGAEGLKQAVNNLTAAGSTRADLGLNRAQAALASDQSEDKVKKVVIMFTDGEPNDFSGFDYEIAAGAINKANELKEDNVDIYTIGVFKDANPEDTDGSFNKYMNAVSSNYPTATANGTNGGRHQSAQLIIDGEKQSSEYYFAANDAGSLNTVFSNIADQVTEGSLEVYPDDESVLSDTLSQYFDFPASIAGKTDPEDVTVQYIPATVIEDDQYTFGRVGEMPEGSVPQVTVGDDGKITITGFNYVDNAISVENGKVTGGGKLVVTFPIELDTVACLTDTTITNGIYPTNVTSEGQQAGLSYKSTEEAEDKDASTLLTQSPTVQIDKSDLNANGTDVTVQVYVDGDLITTNEELENYLSLARPDGTYKYFNLVSNNNGTLTYDFDYNSNPDDGHDCVDIQVNLTNDDYILQGVDSYQIYGQNKTTNVTGEGDVYKIDNVTGTGTNGIDCKIYLRSKYSVQYTQNNEPLDGYTDNTFYISQEDVATTTPTGKYPTDDTSTQMTWKNDNYETSIDLKDLPDAGEGFTVDGWFVGETKYDPADYDADNKLSVAEALKGVTGKTIVFNATTTENAPEKPDDDFVANLLTVTLDCVNDKVSHNDKVYETLLDGSFTVGDVQGNASDGYTVEVSISANQYVADYNTNVASGHSPNEGESGLKSITLTYDGSAWQVGDAKAVTFEIKCDSDYALSGITKTVVTELPDDITDTGYSYPNEEGIVVVSENAENVTLLYAITVSGQSGAHFAVTEDDDIMLVSRGLTQEGNTIKGQIPDGQTSLTFYVAKTFDCAELEPVDVLSNTVKLAGDQGDKVDPDKAEATEEVPVVEEPDFDELLPNGAVEIQHNENDTVYHRDKTYDSLIENSYTYDVSKNVDDQITLTLTVDPKLYVDDYNAKEVAGHYLDPDTQSAKEITWTWSSDAWQTRDETPVAFTVDCESNPEKPDDGTIIALISDKVTIDCTNEAVSHDTKTYGLLEDGYTIGDVIEKDGSYVIDVTVKPDAYVDQYSTDMSKTHELSPEDQGEKVITLTWDGLKWVVGEGVTYTVICSYDITNFDKFLVDTDDEKTATGLTDDELARYTFPDANDTVNVPKNGKVTLLYGITVTGTAGESFTVKDTGAVPASNADDVIQPDEDGNFTSTIPESGSITFYVERVFTADDIVAVDGKDSLINKATIVGDVMPGEEDDDEIVPAATGYSLTYEANGGYFANDATVTTATVNELEPGTYDLWSEENNTIPVGADGKALAEPSHAQAAPPENSVITDADLVDVVLIGWTKEVPESVGKIYAAGEAYPALTTDATITEDDVIVYAVWGYDENGDGVADATQIVITPADITIYTGGIGYEGVVSTEAGDNLGSTANGLPEPGYYFILPAELNKKLGSATGAPIDLSNHLRLNYDDGKGDTRAWTLQLYNPESASMAYDKYVYRIVPDAMNNKDVRLEIHDGNDLITSDEFEIGINTLYQEYDMNLYTDSVERDLVDAEYSVAGDGSDWTDANVNGIALGTAKLTIRGVNDEDVTSNIVATEPTSEVSTITAHADGVTYYTNDSEIPVVDEKAVQLLNDSIVGDNDAMNDLKSAILDQAAQDDTVTIEDDYTFDFRYLDLVDSSNGNAYVTMGDGQSMTLYWPYPEGMDQNDTFYIAHFDGLDREFDGDVANEIATNDDVNLNIYHEGDANYKLETTENGIKFTTSTFSPFALVYDASQADNGGNQGGGGWTPDGGDDGPDGLNTEDHFSYIVGYAEDYRTGEPTDNEDLWPVKPNNQITRAEVATIFYRLLEDEVRDEYDTTVNDFSDVSADSWYNQTVSTLASMGIVKGYEDGSFRPNAPITRAEFGAIATRFFAETGATYEPGTFTDVTGDEWYANAIQDAVNLGLIGGYPDGTVRPNNNITRAEACAIVNRTLGRVPDADHLLPEDVMKVWPDNNPTDWFYADMQEATNGHEYAWIEEDGHEIEEWTNLLDKDWTDR